MRPVRAVTLDAYGTLFDFEGDLRTDAVRDILHMAGAPEHSPESFADAWGVNFHARYEECGRQGCEKFVSIAKLTAEALADTYREHGLELDPGRGTELWLDRLGGVHIFPEVPAVLEALSQRFPLAMVSDIDDRVIAPALERLGWDFEFVLTSEGQRCYKHHPDALIFRRAAERLGLPTESVVHVGDSPADVSGARLAGMRVAWVNRYGRRLPEDCPRPDWEIEDLSALPELLEAPA